MEGTPWRATLFRLSTGNQEASSKKYTGFASDKQDEYPLTFDVISSWRGHFLIVQTVFRTLNRNNDLPTDVLALILSFFLGYLIGSIPMAYLLVRWKSNIDIREAGSGNAGALNSFQVTRSKLVGAMVLVFDALKGVCAVLVAAFFFGWDFSFLATAGVAAVAGHNFPVWLKFRGGRGLATAAGVMITLSWLFVAIWGLMWLIGFLLTRHVNFGNAFASVGEMIGILATPNAVLTWLFSTPIDPGEFRVFAVLLFTIILIKHIDPLKEYFRKAHAQA